MGRMDPFRRTALAVMAAAALTVAGCTGPLEYVRNGFKVGPNYSPRPPPCRRTGLTPRTSSCGATRRIWLVGGACSTTRR